MIFFDQDSVMEPDIVQRLLAHLDTNRPSLIGPLHFDEREGFEYANYVLNGWGYPN